MRVAPFGLILVVVFCPFVRADELRPEFAIKSDPKLPEIAEVKFFPPTYRKLWFQALERPESDLLRLTAETITRAHAYGFPGLEDSKPRLRKILLAPESHPTACTAAARALIGFNAKETAAELFEVSKKRSSNFRELVEPALAKWNFQPIRETWRDRLRETDVRYRDLLLAIRCLSIAGDTTAVPGLLELTLDPLRLPTIRLAAARSCGSLKDAGLEKAAETLAATTESNGLPQLCAIGLLSRHASEESQATLLDLAKGTQPAVVELAMGRLNQINPDSVLPLIDTALVSADPLVRRRGVEVSVARPTAARIERLVALLDDPHPEVRTLVCRALLEFCKRPEFNEVIRPAALAVLNGPHWRGQEQAILLLSNLDHEAIAPRLVELLASTRAEVMVAAAWGLSKIQVQEVLPGLLARATLMSETVQISKRNLTYPEEQQVAHLFEAMGLMKYTAAEPLMRTYLPKDCGFGSIPRTGAAWAIGHLHIDSPEPGLTTILLERATDTSLPPEHVDVQTACAISLGRMRATSAVKLLKAFLGPKISPRNPSLAVRWAIMRITGEQLAEPETPVTSSADWFLTPLDSN